MDIEAIKSILHDTLGIKKEVIALKLAKEKPAGIDAYQDLNNICYMMGEVLEEKKTFYTTLKDHVCTLGCAATGLDPALRQMDDAAQKENEEYHVATVNIFPTEEIQAKAEHEADILFPRFQETYEAVIMGPLGDVPQPDALLLFGIPDQIHLLTRAYCYAVGTFIKGYAGMGACRMLLPLAFINKKPVFTISDRAWRRALQLAPDELTLATPPDKLVIMLEYLEKVR
jgi:uncharacterized protein (DUF169 family)